jgi:hypothetical protein
MSPTKLSLAGNIFLIPGQGEFGTGKSLTFFYSVAILRCHIFAELFFYNFRHIFAKMNEDIFISTLQLSRQERKRIACERRVWQSSGQARKTPPMSLSLQVREY